MPWQPEKADFPIDLTEAGIEIERKAEFEKHNSPILVNKDPPVNIIDSIVQSAKDDFGRIAREGGRQTDRMEQPRKHASFSLFKVNSPSNVNVPIFALRNHERSGPVMDP
jgi:hypothetical protein